MYSSTITSNIPVILLTARRRFVEQKYTQLGVKRILNKPFNPLKLAQQVEAALNY